MAGALLPSALPARADNLLVIGDSLSKEYQVELAGIGGSLTAINVRNWCEILHERRSATFSLGNFGPHADLRITGYDYNWSFPGSFARQWKDIVTDPPRELRNQIRNNVDRVVVWLGGNDIREKYGRFYDGDEPTGPWVNKVAGEIEFVVNWVLQQKPTMPIVMSGVLHVGATPSKNDAHPFDPVKTGRVTSALDAINGRLRAYARSRGLGWAENYEMTRELLTRTNWIIGGFESKKQSDSNGKPDSLFLGDGFHPNWPAQCVFAQRFVDAWNETYGLRIPRLTNREIVKDIMGQNADLNLGNWANKHGVPLADRGSFDDPDGDGIKNVMEMALDLNPALPDAHFLPQPYKTRANGMDFLNLTWQTRDPNNSIALRLLAESSPDLRVWTEIPAEDITEGPSYVRTVRRRIVEDRELFLRLRAIKLP